MHGIFSDKKAAVTVMMTAKLFLEMPFRDALYSIRPMPQIVKLPLPEIETSSSPDAS